VTKRRTPVKTPPRSEREYLRRQMNAFSSMGRFGDWMFFLQMDNKVTAAKIYKMQADDEVRHGHNDQATKFMDAALALWPEVAEWTGRKVK